MPQIPRTIKEYIAYWAKYKSRVKDWEYRALSDHETSLHKYKKGKKSKKHKTFYQLIKE